MGQLGSLEPAERVVNHDSNKQPKENNSNNNHNNETEKRVKRMKWGENRQLQLITASTYQ